MQGRPDIGFCQQVTLMSGTIAHKILPKKKNILPTVGTAEAATGRYPDLILSLPEGYETEIDSA
jgi:ABC-type protease/lipase transport system fused ATPase/permease subunit